MSKRRGPSSDQRGRRTLSPLRCRRCGNRLPRTRATLACGSCGGRYPEREGILDLLPPGEGPPQADPYATPLGWAYDLLINDPALGALASWMGWGADHGRMRAWMDAAIDSEAGEVLVDVPTGGGTAFARAPRRLAGDLYGFDISWPMLKRAARRRERLGLERRVTLARADATRLPLLDQSVDRILCFNGFHVIREKAAVWREFKRVLRPGGQVMGTSLSTEAPLPWSLTIQLTRVSGFFAPPSARALQEQARGAGFRSFGAERSGAMLYFEAA